MRCTIALATTLALCPALAPAQHAAAARAREFRVEAAHSQVTFSVGFVGFPVRGRFDDVKGVLLYAAGHPESSSVTVAIATRSISTGSTHRDEHLRSDDFLDAAKHPTILFQSRSVRRVGDRLEVTGALSLHGVTREVTIPFREVAPALADSHGSTLLTFAGALKLARADYGILGGSRHNDWFDAARSATMADTVDVSLELQAWDPDPDRSPRVKPAIDRVDRDGMPAVLARLRRMRQAAPDTLRDAEWELVQMGRGLLVLGRATEARDILAFAAELFPRSPMSQAAYGRALEATGDRAGAMAQAERTLAADRYDPSALELRRRLAGGMARSR